MRYRFLRFPDGKPKAVTFSYDDGCRADIRLSQLFYKHNLRATFNLNSTLLGDDDWHLTVDEIKDHIISKGHEIAIHGAEHKANGTIKTAEGIIDVAKCRLELERDFDMIIRGMAYPDVGIGQFHNGTTYQDVKTYLTALDIAYARSLCEKNESFELPTDWHNWLPTAHHDHPEIFEILNRFINYKAYEISLSKRLPKLFYLWGHAYEFDKNNNWERIEQICETICNKKDIWYATNIEIYDYVQAYNSLIFSADGSKVYNPTVKQIWFEVDDMLYTIKQNETIIISL